MFRKPKTEVTLEWRTGQVSTEGDFEHTWVRRVAWPREYPVPRIGDAVILDGVGKVRVTDVIWRDRGVKLVLVGARAFARSPDVDEALRAKEWEPHVFPRAG